MAKANWPTRDELLGSTLLVIVVTLLMSAFIFVIEALSSLGQWAAKRFWGKKILLIAPLHHHFEAKGWPETKVTMRFWVIAAVMASVGLVLALV